MAKPITDRSRTAVIKLVRHQIKKFSHFLWLFWNSLALRGPQPGPMLYHSPWLDLVTVNRLAQYISFALFMFTKLKNIEPFSVHSHTPIDRANRGKEIGAVYRENVNSNTFI